MNLDNVVGVLRNRGLKVVEVDGWSTRGYAGQDLAGCAGVMWHHTATNRAAFNGNNMPTLNMLVHGRSDLAGPLANLGLGRDGTVYVIATGVANHAGTGSAYGIPNHSGNHYFIGIEMDSSGIAPWDWTPEMLEAAPRLGAALELAYLQHHAPESRMQLGHMEYSNAGKIDPAGWPGGMDGLRAQINAQIDAWNGSAPSPAPAAPSVPAPAPAPAPAAPVRKTYPLDQAHWTVQAGDTLSKIATFYFGAADGKTLESLAAHNGIGVNAIIRPGERIWIPGPFGWIVEAPDTIESIAARYGYAAQYLAELNDLPSAESEIYVGNTFWIQK